MLKTSASFVLGSSKSSTGTRPPHHSAARTNSVLLIRRTVRPRGYASGFDSPAALLDRLFEHPSQSVSHELRDASDEPRYFVTATFSAYLTISIGWKTGSCDPLEDSASTRCRNGAGPVMGA